MKAIYETTSAGAENIPATKRDSHVSTDGKWRSFPKVPNLLQYVIAGTYYARCKINGKPVRASLDTDVFSKAKQRLPDKLKELRKPKVEVGTFADGRVKFEQQTNCDHTLAELSKVYRLRCVKRLLKSWPDLDMRKVDTITEDECRQWAQRYAEKYSAQFFNNTLNVFRQILGLAGLGRDANPAYKIKRLGVRSKPLELPTTDQFDQLLKEIETSGAGQAKDCADLVSFLSFTGCRIAEMKQALWRDVDWERNEITIHSVKRRATSNASLTRVIPLIPALSHLLERMKEKHQPKSDDRICRVSECQKSLTRACKIVGCARLTHHSLRHLFATRCVESGIDIPTVARWLGHSDGGMLALKIYGHLRREHSQSMAAKVTFGTMDKNCFVALLDILGFKRIMSIHSDEHLKTVYEEFGRAVQHGLSNGKYRLSNHGGKEWLSPDIRRATVNSLLQTDTILIWTDDTSEESFASMVKAVQSLMALSMVAGIPLRGAISIGALPPGLNQQPPQTDGFLLSPIGETLIDAEKYQDWSGCHVSDAAIEFYKRHCAPDQSLNDRKEIISYPVPVKDGHVGGYAIDWVNQQQAGIDIEVVKDAFAPPINRDPAAWERFKTEEWPRVKIKLENTIKFLNHVRSCR